LLTDSGGFDGKFLEEDVMGGREGGWALFGEEKFVH